MGCRVLQSCGKGSGWGWDNVDQDVVRINLIFMTHAGRAAWLCVSEVAAMLQRQLNHE